MTELVAETRPQEFHVFEGCVAQHRFSNKPEEFSSSGFPNHYEKITHYVTLIESQARALDGDADARTRRIIEPREEESVFRYADTSSVRAEIVATSARLKLRKVAIVGLGGTGGYVLDQVAKTPVWQIDLFDGDVFKQHNAFRAPAAATKEVLRERLKKVDYYVRLYDPMRRGWSHIPTASTTTTSPSWLALTSCLYALTAATRGKLCASTWRDRAFRSSTSVWMS
nr:DUF6791 domain-containing protein [Paucibacter sp. M5-1]MCZ7881920.1 hypothetical protein [Paucibacter sp. M5-1]